MVEHGHEQPANIDGGIVDVATASSVGGRVREQRDAWGRDARTRGFGPAACGRLAKGMAGLLPLTWIPSPDGAGSAAAHTGRQKGRSPLQGGAAEPAQS